jgi:ADP-heptose:LPS heptosyltransferase
LDIKKPWLILHAGVSEIKRQFPFALWVRAAKEVINHTGYQIILTGAASEKVLTDDLHLKIGSGSISAGGLFDLEELVLLIDKSPLLLAVNTGTIHIAAAMQTPVVVLYALTNPQHTPWHVPCQVLYFDIGSSLRSRNEVIKYVTGLYDGEQHNYPSTDEILTAINSLLSDPSTGLGNELKLINMTKQQSSLS